MLNVAKTEILYENFGLLFALKFFEERVRRSLRSRVFAEKVRKNQSALVTCLIQPGAAINLDFV